MNEFFVLIGMVFLIASLLSMISIVLHLPERNTFADVTYNTLTLLAVVCLIIGWVFFIIGDGLSQWPF